MVLKQESKLKADVVKTIREVEEVMGAKFDRLGSLRVTAMEPEAFADLVQKEGFGTLKKPGNETERAARRSDALDTTAEYDPARNELILVPKTIERHGLQTMEMVGLIDASNGRANAEWVRDYCVAYTMAAEIAHATGRFERPVRAPEKELSPAFAATVGLVETAACRALERLGYDEDATKRLLFMQKNEDESWSTGMDFMGMLEFRVPDTVKFVLRFGPPRNRAELFNPDIYQFRARMPAG